MPRVTHPGVYVEEVPSGARPISGVGTSTTAFLGRTEGGPRGEAVTVASHREFERAFGGGHRHGELGEAVRLFFANGGRRAVVVRLAEPRVSELKRSGWAALDKSGEPFALMVIPPDSAVTRADRWRGLLAEASRYCQKRRAFLLADAPASWTRNGRLAAGAAEMEDFAAAFVREQAALYYPRIETLEGPTLGAAGAMAGVAARIDGSRGVWKAPAGVEAGILGAAGVEARLSAGESALLATQGICEIRLQQDLGVVAWGARTLAGAETLGSEWKYVPVRRLALFIEESLEQGTRWVVFEPNDEPLWAAIRRDVGAFLAELFRQGALAGSKPEQAFFVKCGADTITAADRARGLVNILVGFAPLKPAEFVVLRIQQKGTPV